ncbi:MAG: AbrB/MazE/SpoVT family DNA-binding domain-containing protein [Candidatus Lokiarchaeota archaeon]|nr:AbrB/MazE/SpoVT family DNA-binding domain-containing protein [Candidatus Lokiarchaeota archaeon]
MKPKYCKISTKGQLTIPKDFRDELKLNEGDEVLLYIQDGGIVIKPKTTHIGMLRGLLRDEIELNKAIDFVQSERKKWRI